MFLEGSNTRMERKFAICDPALDGRPVAVLLYNTDEKMFRIEIKRDVDESKLPISLKVHAELGRFDLNSDFSMDWVRSRVCPPSRHNISTILQELGLPEYDEFGLILHTGGKSLMDDLFLNDV